ncbi:MAG: GNAT family N-acetyltransferase [Gaiellales bacterium]
MNQPPSAVAIRRCREEDRGPILEIVNDAAEAYRGVIPADRWRDPYMSGDELDRELAAGVAFWGYERHGRLDGVMGIQSVDDVELIRHAYVRTERQGEGVGGALLAHLRSGAAYPLLVGTWTDATWAIRFYERHGFVRTSRERTRVLLTTYWSIPERQIETSVVLELAVSAD